MLQRGDGVLKTAISVVASLLLVSCVTPPRAPDEGGPAWVQVTSEHLVVTTDLDPGRARAVSRELEVWRSAVTTAVFPDANAPEQRLEVIVLPFREFEVLMPYRFGFFTDLTNIGPVLLLGPSAPWDMPRAVRHELAHAVIDENIPNAPKWLHEGLAKYLETAEIDDATGELRWGMRDSYTAIWYEANLLPVEKILDAREWELYPEMRLEYSAGILVHMLVRLHREGFACFIAGLRQLEPYEQAMERCLGPMSEWGPAYMRERFEGGDEPLGTAKGPREVLDNPTLRPLSDADVHAILALVNHVVAVDAGAKGERHDRFMSASAQHWKRALQLNPTHLMATFVELKSGAKGQGEIAANLVRNYPDDWRAWVWRALSAPLPEAREAAERAIKLAPGRYEPYAARALASLRAKQGAEGLEFAREAARRNPKRFLTQWTLYFAFESQHQCEEARSLLASEPQLKRFLHDAVASGQVPFPSHERCSDL
jgi:hypothetical protein